MTEIIKTINDLKQHIAIDFIEGFDVLEYAVEDREYELKKKYIGDDLWKNLVEQYNGSFSDSSSAVVNLTAKLLWFCQRVIANFSLLDYIPEGQLDISENGIRITTTDNKKQAFDWQIKKLENKYRSTAERNLEALLQLLNQSIDSFPEWTTSDAYVANKGHFVNSAIEFSQYLNIGKSHLVFLDLLPSINYIEDFYIRSVLGDDFYNELKERIKDGEDVDEPPADPDTSQDDEYDKVFNLVKAATVYYTGAQVAETKKELNFDKDQCSEKADHTIQRLVEYLNRNASDTLFKKYFESDKYTAPVDDETPFTSGDGIDNSEFTGVYGAF